ncbi:hypothetical protein Q1695_000277 [Nippostrongylus brasiliensis]|nr:hypothetical protein Q1695_000277 [Nippostrongylus brasiliensis]
MVEYYVMNQWVKLPSSWQVALKNMEPEDCVCLLTRATPSRIVLPLSILCIKTIVNSLPSREGVKSPSELAKALGTNNVEQRDFEPLSSLNNVRRKLKMKKEYEVDRVVAATSLLKGSGDAECFNTIIDIGAGVGHLSRALAIAIPSCSIVAVEHNKELIEQSERLNASLLSRDCGFIPPIHHCESVQHDFHGYVVDTLRGDQKALLIGLHPCGDLSASILRIFTRAPNVSAVMLFGCCYHKLSVNNGNEGDVSTQLGFPLSKKFGDIRLTPVALDLACHGNEKYVDDLLTKSKSVYRCQCFRALLEYIFVMNDKTAVPEQRKKPVVHSVNPYEGITFEAYLRKALSSSNPNAEEVIEMISDNPVIDVLKERVEEEWRRLLVVHCLRLMFAPIVEQLMIADRVEYIREHGHEALVVPLFDPKISSRNLTIFARKKTKCA